MLDASLSADVTTDAVHLALTVENRGNDPVEVTFPTGQRAEFTAYPIDSSTALDPSTATDSSSGTDGLDADGSADPVWRYGEGQMFTQAFATETLAASSAVTYDATWSTPPSGEYRIVGELRAVDPPNPVESTAIVDVSG